MQRDLAAIYTHATQRLVLLYLLGFTGQGQQLQANLSSSPFDPAAQQCSVFCCQPGLLGTWLWQVSTRSTSDDWPTLGPHSTMSTTLTVESRLLRSMNFLHGHGSHTLDLQCSSRLGRTRVLAECCVSHNTRMSSFLRCAKSFACLHK